MKQPDQPIIAILCDREILECDGDITVPTSLMESVLSQGRELGIIRQFKNRDELNYLNTKLYRSDEFSDLCYEVIVDSSNQIFQSVNFIAFVSDSLAQYEEHLAREEEKKARDAENRKKKAAERAANAEKRKQAAAEKKRKEDEQALLALTKRLGTEVVLNLIPIGDK